MAKENTSILRSLSVIIPAEYHNPSIINPDFLLSTKIIPEAWKTAEPVITPGLAILGNDNGIQLTVDPNRLTISEERDEPFLEQNDSSIHNIAAKYVTILSHIPYRALGLNCVVSIARNSPKEWLTKKFLNSDLKNSGFYMTPKFIIDMKKYRLNLNFTYRQGLPDNDDEVIISCNTHYSGPFDSESLCEKINQWSDCQKNIKDALSDLL